MNLCWVLARIATDHFTTTRSELLAADWLATVSQKRFEAHSRTVAGSGRCHQVNPLQPSSFPCLAIVR